MRHGIIVPGVFSFYDFKKGLHTTGRSVRRNFMLGSKYSVCINRISVKKNSISKPGREIQTLFFMKTRVRVLT